MAPFSDRQRSFKRILELHLALLLCTHPDPRALGSCQSVGKLSDRKHSSLIMDGNWNQKRVCLQEEGSVVKLIQMRESFIQFVQLYLMHYYFGILPS